MHSAIFVAAGCKWLWRFLIGIVWQKTILPIHLLLSCLSWGYRYTSSMGYPSVLTNLFQWCGHGRFSRIIGATSSHPLTGQTLTRDKVQTYNRDSLSFYQSPLQSICPYSVDPWRIGYQKVWVVSAEYFSSCVMSGMKYKLCFDGYVNVPRKW